MSVQSVAKKLLIGGILFFACCAGAFVFIMHSRSVDFSILENYNPGQPSILLDDQGRQWGKFQLDRRKFVSLELMPQSLRLRKLPPLRTVNNEAKEKENK